MARDFAQSSTQFLASIDAEIGRLQSLREQVASAVNADATEAKPAKSLRRGMSAEGRRKIAKAQKARWAKRKKAGKSVAKALMKKTSAKKSDGKNTPAKRTAAVRTFEQA